MAIISCPDCRREVSSQATACPNCGYPVSGCHASTRRVRDWNPGVAAALSAVVPGLGQIYKGRIGRALLLMVGLVVSLALSPFFIGLYFLPLLWLWGVVDAYTGPALSDGQVRGRAERERAAESVDDELGTTISARRE